jgi:hypothetical protein
MKIRRKTSRCLNCGLDLDPDANYCQRCGQENTDNNVSFGTLANDFVTNYFSWDGRFGRSVVPFLFIPGKLTREFIIGRRKTFMHPVRLYLIVSLVFFTVIAFYVQGQVEQDFQAIRFNDNGAGSGQLMYNVEEDNGQQKRRLVFVDENNDTVVSEDISLPPEVSHKLDSLDKELATGLVMKANGATQEDSAKATNRGMSLMIGNEQSDMEYEQLLKMARDLNYSETQILDSVNAEPGTTAYFVGKQLIRLSRADGQSVTGYIIKNLPIMMFLLMPLFALMLKLLYVRRESLYIHHLVHAIHIHSFLYLALLLIVVAIWTNFLTGLFIPLLSAAFLVYVFISFRRVYAQDWFKTIVKMGILGFAYFFVLSVAFFFEALISLALY